MGRRMAHLGVGIALVAVALVGGGLPSAAADVCDDHQPFAPDLGARLAEQHPGQRFSASVYDQRTGCQYHLNREERITTASVFKIEVMAAVLLRAQREGRDVTSLEWSRMVPMITESADPPTSALFLSLGGTNGFASIHADFGMTETSLPPAKWGATVTSAADQVNLIRQVVLGEYGPLEAPGRQLARTLMTSVVPSQQWGISAGVPERWTVPLKNGFFPLGSSGWRINSAGFVEDLAGSGYVMVILSDGWPTEAQGIAAVESVAAEANAALLPLSAPPGVPYVDVGVDDWFYEPVVWAHTEGVTRGVSPTLFDPLTPLTRGQLAAFLVRALDLPPSDEPAHFVDTESSVFHDDIERLWAAGVTRGCNPPSGDRYCPERPVTRAEVAAMVARALDLPPPPTGNRFDDDDGSIFERDLERMAAAGLLRGCNPPDLDEVCPFELANRAHMVAILERVSRR